LPVALKLRRWKIDELRGYAMRGHRKIAVAAWVRDVRAWLDE